MPRRGWHLLSGVVVNDAILICDIVITCAVLGCHTYALYTFWHLGIGAQLALVSSVAVTTILFSPGQSTVAFVDAHPRFTTLLVYALVAYLVAWVSGAVIDPVLLRESSPYRVLGRPIW